MIANNMLISNEKNKNGVKEITNVDDNRIEGNVLLYSRKPSI